MIPQNIIEDIKFRCPVDDVISSYVVLKKAGNNLKGLCPFHSERTPSFTVFPQTQSYYCFGCGAGGDVFNFLMKTENISYGEAIEHLAKRCGITLPDSKAVSDKGTSRSRILEMNLEAARFFRETLFDDSAGAVAREYLVKRKLSTSLVKHFGIGFAPDSFDSLRNRLRSKGFTFEEMQDAFLCRKSEKSGNYFDLFRNRVIFPIIDNSGNVIAFGGRVLDDSTPKYLNTSDTSAFKKSKNLFALNFARHTCSERLIVCEGYMDVIALHSAGFENSVATLGTAITSEHARILKKYTKKVILSYDSDGAGRNATDKALRLLSEVGLEASVLVIKDAKDPDEFIKKFRNDKFRELLDGSRTRFDYKLESVLDEHDVSNDVEKIKAISEITSYISHVSSKVEREIYIKKASKVLGVSERNLNSDVDSEIRRSSKKYSKSRREELIRKSIGVSERVNLDFSKNPLKGKLEETILGMIFLMNEYVSAQVDGSALSIDDFSTDYCRRLFEFVSSKNNDGGFNMSLLTEAFSEEEVSKAYGFLASRSELKDNSPEIFYENVQKLRSLNVTEKEDSSDSLDSIINLLNMKNK